MEHPPDAVTQKWEVQHMHDDATRAPKLQSDRMLDQSTVLLECGNAGACCIASPVDM